jgi:hypothetical protein
MMPSRSSSDRWNPTTNGGSDITADGRLIDATLARSIALHVAIGSIFGAIASAFPT